MSRKKNYRLDLNEQIDKLYDAQLAARIVVGAIVGVGAAVKALAGLGLSFTALLPLVVGGIIGPVFPVSLVLVATGLRSYCRSEFNELKKGKGIVEKCVIAALAPPFLLATIASIAAGVGFAATANVILL